MKRIAAILLICLLLFNWYGYRFVTNYLQHKADRQLESQIDLNQYSDAQLVELKVPLDMPYQSNQSSFERHYGELRIDGKIYTYVKRKIENGYLVLKCIPNTTKQELQNADNIMFNVNNGLDQEHNGGKNNSPLNNLSKTSLTDYDDFSYEFDITAFSLFQKNYLFSGNSSTITVSLPVAEQPPEYFSVNLS